MSIQIVMFFSMRQGKYFVQYLFGIVNLRTIQPLPIVFVHRFIRLCFPKVIYMYMNLVFDQFMGKKESIRNVCEENELKSSD